MIEINSKKEENEIESLPKTLKKNYFWLGLRHSKEQNGTFVWISSGRDTKKYSNWDDQYPIGRNDTCGLITQSHKWTDGNKYPNEGSGNSSTGI